jgi:hypothetical protein
MSTYLCPPQLREQVEQQSGDFGIARLGGVPAFSFQRLVYWPWDAVTFFFVLHHHTAPPPIRLRAARTL